MAGITPRITLFVMTACILVGLISSLNILPEVNTMPGWNDNQASFEAMAQPNTSGTDWYVMTYELAITAVTVFLKSLITVVFIVPVLAQYGVGIEYIVAIQTFIWGLYGYDAIALWKGWDPI